MRISEITIDLDATEEKIWATRKDTAEGRPSRGAIVDATWKLAQGFEAPVQVHVRAASTQRNVNVFTSTYSAIGESRIPLRVVLAMAKVVVGDASAEEWHLVATEPALGGIDRTAEMLAYLERQKANPNEPWTIPDGWKVLLTDGT